MVKFKITPERFATACSALQYMGVKSEQENIMINTLPRFMVDDKGEYIIKVKIDEDGDVEAVEDADMTLDALTKITPKRLETLYQELREAANGIVKKVNEGV